MEDIHLMDGYTTQNLLKTNMLGIEQGRTVFNLVFYVLFFSYRIGRSILTLPEFAFVPDL